MSKHIKRFVSLLLGVILVLGLCGTALADYEEESPGWTDPLRLDGSLNVPSGDPGQTVTLVIPVIFSPEFGWASVRDISLTPVMSNDSTKWPFVINRSPYTINMELASRRARATYSFTISQEVKAGIYPLEFKLVYVAANGLTRQSYDTTITAYVNVLSDGVDYKPEDEESKSLIVLGQAEAPSAYIEKDVTPPRVTMNLPLVNTSSSLTDVSIEPVISNDIEKFPFVVESQNYRQELGNFSAGETRTVSYEFPVSELATAGAKAVEFKLEYTQNGTKHDAILTAFVNIDRYKEEEDEDDEVSSPKLIISSYTIVPDKVYAGNNFTMQLNFTNTSKEAIENITISITNADEENAYVVPARSGSNTIYIENMAAGATVARSLEMQVRPDTPAKPNMLRVLMDYENSKHKQFKGDYNITVPINQELRVQVGDPRIDNPYPEQGSTTYGSLTVINMGKSSIYNANLRVEGAGLSLEEPIYMGTVKEGGQYNADFALIVSETGDIVGELIVTYEDDFGEEMEERREFTLSVSEPFMPDESMMGPEGDMVMPEEDGGGMLKWVLAGGGLLVLIVLVVFIKKRRAKKRLAELEDDGDDGSEGVA